MAKAASARGRIDAFYRFVIFEVKRDLEEERDDALTGLKKYFESQKDPSDYVASVTDGLHFEVFDYDYRTKQPKLLRSFEVEAEAPQVAYGELDELLAAGRKIPPLSGEVVIRFGPTSLTFNRSRQALRDAFESVKDLSDVKVKFQEWNALLAKVYGSSPDDEDLFIKHTYLTMVSRAVVTLALFHNPWASKPLPSDWWPLPQRIANLEDGQVNRRPGATVAAVLGLPNQWPPPD